MTIKLYIDYLSQPSRAVYIFCLANKIPFEVVETRIGRMEQRSPQFVKINPMKKVPAIFDTENQFPLPESHAIMRYLSRKYNVKQNWYPQKDLIRMAKIDEYLDHHHTVTRKIANLIFYTFFAKNIGIPTTDFNADKAKKDVEFALKCMEKIFLVNGDYIVGNQPSIADLSAYCQIQQLFILLNEFDLNKYPNLKNWMERVSKIPEVKIADDKLHKVVNMIKSKL